MVAVGAASMLFVASVAVPAFGGPTAFSAASLGKRVSSALKLARAADKRSKRADRRARRALRLAAQSGPMGPTGPQGPDGTPGRGGTGSPYAANGARGWALVGRTGGIETRRSANLYPLNVTHPGPGQYCFISLVFNPTSIEVLVNNASPDDANQSWSTTARLLPDDPEAVGCPADSQASVTLHRWNNTGRIATDSGGDTVAVGDFVPDDASFYVVFH